MALLCYGCSKIKLVKSKIKISSGNESKEFQLCKKCMKEEME